MALEHHIVFDVRPMSENKENAEESNAEYPKAPRKGENSAKSDLAKKAHYG